VFEPEHGEWYVRSPRELRLDAIPAAAH
jgi:hypothetical protein